MAKFWTNTATEFRIPSWNVTVPHEPLVQPPHVLKMNPLVRVFHPDFLGFRYVNTHTQKGALAVCSRRWQLTGRAGCTLLAFAFYGYLGAKFVRAGKEKAHETRMTKHVEREVRRRYRGLQISF